MSLLLYCIFGTSARQDLALPMGIGQQPVVVVTRNGLSAALSELAESDLVPDISRTLAYGRVVEHFFRSQAIIPMRYGCKFENASDVVSMLVEHQREYQKLLGDLQGLDEMGIRVLLGKSEGRVRADTSLEPSATALSFDNSGAAYLAAKQEHFRGLDQAVLDQHLLVDELCASLSGLFVRRKVESPDLTISRLLSLYFLVPKASVEAFRHAARRLHPKNSVKLLLSGPWPPYNFVDSLDS